MDTWKTRTRKYLTDHRGKAFTSLEVLDESAGRYVKDLKILNKFLARHLKVTLNLEASVGDLGRYLYRSCRDLIQPTDFWTSRRGQVVFFYTWA